MNANGPDRVFEALPSSQVHRFAYPSFSVLSAVYERGTAFLIVISIASRVSAADECVLGNAHQVLVVLTYLILVPCYL